MSLNEVAGSENAEAYTVVTPQCSRRPRTKLKGIFRVMNGGMFKKVNWTFSTSRKSRSGGMADTHV